MSHPDLTTDTLSLAAAAAQLGVHPRTISRAIARGEITAARRGRNLEISRASLARFGTQTRRRGRASHLTPIAPPTPLSSFIGREQLVIEIGQHVQRRRARVITLTGPGGVGKTRLALQVLQHQAAVFPESVAFVPLAAVTDAALVLPAIARTLGLPGGGERAAAEQLRRALAREPFLLVLDNLEQVRDAGPALAELVAACQDLVVLVTSRVRLQVAGEHCVPVPPLTLPPAVSPSSGSEEGSTLRALTQAEAVRLFVERARAVLPHLVLTSENGRDVEAICRRLDGVPLALELAAARLRHLHLADLRARLDSALPLLVGGPQDAPLRLQTMRTAIAWSYDLLTPTQQTLFRSLAVFVGGFAGDAAAAMQQRLATPGWARSHAAPQPGENPPPVLEGLSVLIDHSLLQIAPPASRQAQPTTRYFLLETIREYGLEQLLAAGEEDRVRSAHAAWCLDLAWRSENLGDGAVRDPWFARLEQEHLNFRAALAWYLEQEDYAAGFTLIRALAWFWTSRGYLHEAMGWARAFLALPQGAIHPLRGEVLRETGNIAHWLGDTGAATRYYEAALARFQEMDDQLGIRYTLRQLGSVAIEQGDVDAAAGYLAASAAMASPAEGVLAAWDRAFERYLHGRLKMASGQTAGALLEFAEAAAGFSTINDREYLAAVSCQRAAAFCEFGDILEARRAWRDGLTFAIELDLPYWMAWGVAGAAYLALQANQRSRAARLHVAARHLLEDTGLPWPGEAVFRVLNAQLAHAGESSTPESPQETRARALREAMSVLADAPSAASQPAGPLMDLTPREREVLAHLAQGMTDKEIARALEMSRHTAVNHVAAIRRKLGVPTRAAAVAVAARRGTKDEPEHTQNSNPRADGALGRAS